MLNQEKIGKYITEKRKGLGLTQKQLADKVGLTDKAVSKWERGKSMPDNDIITSICEALNISVNEFLSGEDILSEEYSDKAEKNIMSLIEDNKKQTKGWKLIIISLCIGFLFLLLGSYSMMLNLYKPIQIASFIDLPSILFVLGMTAVISVVAGTIIDFVNAFLIVLHKGNKETYDIRRSIQAVKLALLVNILGAFIYFLGQMIMITPQFNEMSDILSVISISMLPIWYAALIDLILIPIYFRLKNMEVDGQ